MEDKNKALVKIVEAMDAAGYVVKSIVPERHSDGMGCFTDQPYPLIVRIVPAGKA